MACVLSASASEKVRYKFIELTAETLFLLIESTYTRIVFSVQISYFIRKILRFNYSTMPRPIVEIRCDEYVWLQLLVS